MSKKEDSLGAKLQRELIALREEVRNDVTGPVVASFGFIIALIWRDAIQVGIHEILVRLGLTKQAYIFQFLSAIIVTLFVILLMVTVTKLSRRKTEKKIDKAVEEIEKKT